MSADLLRRAATTLREHAEQATPGPWDSDEYRVDGPADSHGLVADTMNGDRPDNYQDEANAQLIALMHPPVVLALADLLQVLSWMPSFANPTDMQAATALARKILREETPDA